MGNIHQIYPQVPQADDDGPPLSVAEAGRALGYSRAKMYEMIKRRLIGCHRPPGADIKIYPHHIAEFKGRFHQRLIRIDGPPAPLLAARQVGPRKRQTKRAHEIAAAGDPDWVVDALRAAKRRAKKRGLEFSLEVIDVLNRHADCKGCCEVSGIAFDLAKSMDHWRRPMAPSIDRIDPKRGYTPDNVRLVIYAVNAAMNEWGLELFLKVARAAAKKARQRDRANG
jgi:hypothetical protein